MNLKFINIRKMEFSFILLLILFLNCFELSTQASQKKYKNVLLICVDDLRPELKSFGASYIHSPNIDRLANEGRAFMHHYVNAPSCGPSRYTLLTGCYGPPVNAALFVRAKKIADKDKQVTPTMPEWFRQNGYTTVSVGKVSHHPGGLGGEDWNDPDEIEMPNAWNRNLMPVGEWQHPRGAMHGLAHGEIRENRNTMDVFQSIEGPDTIYPDGLIVNEGLSQLEQLAADKNKPFFLAIGIIKPHLPFGAPRKYLDLYKEVELPPIPNPNKPEGVSTWHKSGEFMQYNTWGKDPRIDEKFADKARRHYAACVSYADAQVGRILEKLKQTGADKNTIIVLWGDHGWNLGEHGIWGKHNLFEEALHSPLIIKYPGMAQPGIKTNGMIETCDIFPTLCELTSLPMPKFVSGMSMVPIINNPKYSGHPVISYWRENISIRTLTHRLIVHKDGAYELYDHTSKEKETANIASENSALVKELQRLLESKMK